MANICPLCGQGLPHAIDEKKLQMKLEKLTAAARQAERRELVEEYSARLRSEREVAREQIEKVRKSANTEAEVRAKRQLDELKRQFEKQKIAEIAKLRRDAELSAQRGAKLAIEQAAFDSRKKIEVVQMTREKEQVRHATEMANLQGKLDELSRKLEKQSSGQFGEEGEIDLFAELGRKFPGDQIERIGRGVKGADILHKVMDGGKEAGRIVYESKNHAIWKNDFIAQVKRYHTLYETACVMIVSRVLPKKLKGMCVSEGVPVVEPHLAASLACVMREGIIEIAKLNLTKVGSDGKSKELFEYIIGNEFQTRFRDVAEAVGKLRDFQNSERTWHENHWTKQSDLHERIQRRHREIDAKLQLVLRSETQRKALSASSRGLPANYSTGLA